jgi:hypothetical protein
MSAVCEVLADVCHYQKLRYACSVAITFQCCGDIADVGKAVLIGESHLFCRACIKRTMDKAIARDGAAQVGEMISKNRDILCAANIHVDDVDGLTYGAEVLGVFDD